ncbi:YbaL family putative K(+) efflux transporter [Marilutibacter maris]|uniref:YbaL family putative K(+) efflux transporter n=1 Tax=Marilutibacter maris TaxID=1605891 RepID=UPI000DAA4AD8|nr:YbaL family putative K(+) efflux transporter [Lysobacter maris]
MHHTSLLALLVGGFVLAFVLGALAQRCRLPPLLGYLLAGVALGPFTPGFVGDAELAPQLAEIGVILLMFGVGLHFSLADLMKVRSIALPGAAAQIAVATLMGWGLARWLDWSNMAGLIFGLALSVASTVVLLRALEERRLIDTSRGQIAVGWLIVEDIAMVLALVLLPAVSGDAGDGATRPLLIAVLATLAKVGGFVAFMLIVGRRVIPWLLGHIVRMANRELFTLCVLAIALGVAFGSATLFGVSFALGAFFAGMVLNESEFSSQAANETLPLRDAFAVLFFVSVGMLFNPSILVERPIEVALTALIIVVGKSVAAYAIVRAFGRDNSTSLLISASLAQIGEFSFILATLGLQLEVLPHDGQDLILAGAIISIIINPFLFTLLDRRKLRKDRQAEAAKDAVAPLPIELSGHVMLIGYGRVGRELARLLATISLVPVVVDAHPDRIDAARKDGHLAVLGNAADVRVLHEARVDTADFALIAVPLGLEASAIAACLRQQATGLTIIGRAHSEESAARLLDYGADAAVIAEKELAYSIVAMIEATPQRRGSTPLPPARGFAG